MGADGKLRNDVITLLKKHGRNNFDDKAPDEIMHMLEAIETNLHGDNIEREIRIEGYQNRRGALREHAGQIVNNAKGASRKQAQELAAREPYEVKTRLAIDAPDEIVDVMQEAETTERAQAISSTFTLG